MKVKLLEKLKQNDIVKAVVSMLIAGLFASIVGLVGSFIQGRLITAEELGFFKQFNIITGYLFFLHFGTFHAIERLYPIYMTKGENDKAIKVVETGNAWIVIVCVSVTLFFTIASFVSFIQGKWKNGLCWIVEITAIWTNLYGGFLSATFRSGKEFQKMARANVANPIISLLLIPFYWVQPFVTMIMRNMTSVVSTIRLHLFRPVKVKFRFSFKEWLKLVKIGLPIFTASYITTTGLDAVRGSLILIFLTKEDLGYWSFAYMCITLVFQLPTTITGVYAPRIMSEYAKNNDMSSALKIAQRPILAGFAIMSFLIPSGVVCVHFLLPVILPKYIGSIGIIYILLAAVPLKLSDSLNSVLVAANKVKALNTIAIFSTAVQICVSLLCAFLELGIISFAIGFLIGYFIRFATLLVHILFLIKKEKDLKVSNER